MPNDPVLIVFAARRKPDGETVWTEIGHAIPHEQGAGLTVVLTAAPIDGRIILLEPRIATTNDITAQMLRIPIKLRAIGSDSRHLTGGALPPFYPTISRESELHPLWPT